MPIIGIPCRSFERASPYPPVHGHHETYIRAIEDAGGAVVLIPVFSNRQLLEQIWPMLDGLLLAGGIDVDPSFYNQQPHPKLDEINPAQDAVEIQLTRWAMAERKPVLAICRGVQLLNVAAGGTLYQDIPDQMPSKLNHQQSHEQQQRSLCCHDLLLEHDSRLSKLLGATQIAINSLHHQAICDIAPYLKAVGWSDDGLVEAVESINSQWLVGVQCHPEELRPRWNCVFENFVEAATEWRNAHER